MSDTLQTDRICEAPEVLEAVELLVPTVGVGSAARTAPLDLARPLSDGHTEVAGRYERKIRVAPTREEWVRSLIRQHPARLCETYPARYVNNLYLDTACHTHYVDHINGVARRKKFRLRWYGPLDATRPALSLEVKRRDGWINAKHVYPLSDSCPGDGFKAGGWRQMLGTSKFPVSILEAVVHLEPALVNRYHRRYYESHNRQVRVTVDTDMSFYHASRLGERRGGAARDQAVIVEIKFDADAVEYGTHVAAAFPVSLSKNSKYVNGIQLLYGRG